MAAVDHAHQIDVDHPLPVGQVAVEELAEVDDAGIVVEHVRCPQFGDHLLAEGPHGRFAADVDPVDVALHTQSVDFFLQAPQCFELQVAGDDVGTLAGEGNGGRAADAGGRASDQDLFALQLRNCHG